jgi:hypothetical protein
MGIDRSRWMRWLRFGEPPPGWLVQSRLEGRGFKTSQQQRKTPAHRDRSNPRWRVDSGCGLALHLLAFLYHLPKMSDERGTSERVSEEVLFCCLGINTHPIASRRKTTRGQNFVRSVEYGVPLSLASPSKEGRL